MLSCYSESHLTRPRTGVSRARSESGEIESGRENAIDPRIPLAVAGNRCAAQSLLSELLPRVGNLVRYLIGSDSEVEDITQRVLIEILNSLRTYRGESKFTTWTDRITVRTTLSHIRRRRLLLSRLRTVSVELFSGRDLEQSGNPERCAARQEMARVLDSLPADQRVAVVLHYAVGLSVPELADRLQVPFETVRSRLRIGMQKLRKHFGILEESV